MNFSKQRPVKVIMLGAGGTGAHIAPHLYRLLYALDRPVKFIICDGDKVEPKNLVRQNFTQADLGENKSKVIAERYQLAQPDTKTAIFEHLCDLYNYVDASIHVQFSFLNRRVDPVQYAKSFEIAPQEDDFDDIRAEYTGILQKQLANGNNGIVKTKYLTFTIEADSPKSARARLNRIGLDLLG